ncbi:HindIII family type II restriction endonuclease [Larsenimonas suaedae]|uniref:HindIII family type II restriction endonuclease n=1 Tax=Larsenimonas suaedae TaxID=1851019 RepID=A0ABU1GZ04_9GAMM|nr:HindIII family type II restriction endonuclease [Larsenimonas suaedae]MCM2973753.1 HindIII family type II restriction endonuclease [Larsenimonas suaedae]MDR5897277.1 HindIII family type II restriction endonuclease [Larsenimonas suaedae]
MAVDIKALFGEWFGDTFKDNENRYVSYEVLSDFILEQHTDWNLAPDTEGLARKFAAQLRDMPKREFAFLLCHTGYIPEVYKADSSQETLYTKLVEAVACEWAIRLGFTDSTLPTQKASKEDVTISDENKIIVCDAKSYRLGRSQAAPNVKDALKKGDITKWLSHYKADKRVGGLVTFPSQHDWKNGSDFYLYLTDKNSPIVMLFYEHMAFMLLTGMEKQSLLNFFERHAEIFPNEETNKSGSRKVYFEKITEHLLNTGVPSWNHFQPLADYVVSEKVYHTKAWLDEHLTSEEAATRAWVDSLPVETLKEELVAVRYQLDNQNLLRQRDNILKFRKILKK